MKLIELKASGQAPEWLTEEGFSTLSKGYLLENETPTNMYRRVANAAASYLPVEMQADYQEKFFQLIWKNWLCLATPVASNMGTSKGLPISCFASYVPDSMVGIFNTNTEIAVLSKAGGGTASYLGHVRGRGAAVSTGGISSGTAGWARIFRQTVHEVKQGSNLRRGQHATYLDIEHPDIETFIDLRKHLDGIHLGVCISDAFLKKCQSGDAVARALWAKLIKARMETGEPYFFFSDKVNNSAPEVFKNKRIYNSNLCTEIVLPTDEFHSFVCCISSMNAMRFDEWKDTEAVFLATVFLDCVLEEFLVKAATTLGIERTINFAVKCRALGLGVLGYHSYLQENSIAFNSFQARNFNNRLFKHIKEESYRASRYLGELLGVPEWCTDMRNATTMAVAPTTSNAIISGGLSQGIEPFVANCYTQKTAKGTFLRKNPHLQKLLALKSMDTDEVWEQISINAGSVAKLDGLSADEKEVFKTAFEIEQKEIIWQANQRQKHIDQAQSLNLFFSHDEDPQYIHDCHWEAAKSEFIKTLYYVRSSSSLRADRQAECKACEG